MAVEGEIILKYHNVAGEKKESLWQKDKPILSFTVLHLDRSHRKEKRQIQQRRGRKEMKVATSQCPCC